jgi:uncharacterized protein (DUF2252 family)
MDSEATVRQYVAGVERAFELSIMEKKGMNATTNAPVLRTRKQPAVTKVLPLNGEVTGLTPEFWQTHEAPYHPRMPLESVADRFEKGKALRARTPVEAHAEWKPASGRPDAVGILLEGNKGRQEELVPLRMSRMAASPFAFLRGAAAVMASDLAKTPISGIQVAIDGDAHINNFGLYGTPQRDVVIDLNDFDEATLGPWEWDLKRLVASVNVAGRENGLDRKERRSAVSRCVSAYAMNSRRLMDFSVLDVWSINAYADLERIIPVLKQYGIRVCNKFQAVMRKTLAKARQTTSQTLLGKVARRQADGGWRFNEDPPVLTRVDNATRDSVAAALVEYAETVPADLRYMLKRYSVADVAHRVVGVGSVGVRAYLVLMFGNGDQDPLFLQVKEALPPAHAPYLPTFKVRVSHEGRRVVGAQRLLQALGDPFLGYTTIDNRPYFVRQMKNMKASMPIEFLTGEPFEFWAWACGALLSRAHARTGDAAKTAGYIGKSDALATALSEFAESYGDQTERDHSALVGAIKKGRVKAAEVV